MKRNIKKPLCITLCTLLLAGSVGIAAHAAVPNEKNFGTAAASNGTAGLSSLNSDMLAAAAPSASTGSPLSDAYEQNSKTETVYVFASASGEVHKIIVSDWIHNPLGSDTLTDSSTLGSVENVKGDETYTVNEAGLRVWDAKGNDIYCQGTADRELPVSVSVSFSLDGVPVSAEELAGKSGRVKIRFDYINKCPETVEIDGKKEDIHVPFAMLTGVLLDGDVFSNVEVSNGKLVNDGDRIIAAGLAFPGLQENLGIDSEKLEIPNYVEITADAKNFKLTSTVTIAANELFNNIDSSKFDDIDSLKSSMTELSDSMTALTDGSSALYDGLCTLLEKSDELAAGIDALAEGAARLKAGAQSAAQGAESLCGGADALAAGLAQIDSGSASLNNGAEQIFNSMLANANAQLAAAGLDIPALTIENYAQVLNAVIAQLGGNAPAIEQLKAQLDSYNAFYTGLQSYTAGVGSAKQGADNLAAGAAQLRDGTGALSTGAGSLYDGILELKNGIPALSDGVSQLRDGAMQLNDGLNELNEKGIQKLIDAVNGDVSSLAARLRATADVSKEYKSFSGLAEGTDGSVKFIYRTESIG